MCKPAEIRSMIQEDFVRVLDALPDIYVLCPDVENRTILDTAAAWIKRAREHNRSAEMIECWETLLKSVLNKCGPLFDEPIDEVLKRHGVEDL